MPCDFHEIYVSGKNTTYYYNRNIYITEYQYYKVFVQVILSTFSAICWHIIDTATRPAVPADAPFPGTVGRINE